MTVTPGQALNAVARYMATDSRDWGETRGDAWLYGVLVGWDCEENHDHELDHCEGGGAVDEIAARHSWTAAQRSRIRDLRAAVRQAVEGAEPERRGLLDFGGGFIAISRGAGETAARATGAPVCEHGYQLSARSIEIGIPVHMATGKLCGAPEQPFIAKSESAARTEG